MLAAIKSCENQTILKVCKIPAKLVEAILWFKIFYRDVKNLSVGDSKIPFIIFKFSA